MVQIRDIGIALDGAGSQLQELERHLAYYHECGYRLVELDPTPYALIVDGELRRPQVENFCGVLRNFDLRYSLHGLERPNLAYGPQHELCRRIMLAQIEICRTVGASTLVYHSGLQALDAARHGLRGALLTDDELAAGARQEVEAFRALAPFAADAGVIIAVENGDPHLWEYNLLSRFGRPRSELPKHHARLHVRPIVRQLEAIDHPNVGMTLDVAHLYIAALDVGFDYLEAVSEAAPWVRHLHVNDNFGRLDQGVDEESERQAFGEGDLHMPPGWGCIPHRELLARLPGYQGDVILEIKPSFWDYLGDALRTMQDILDNLET